MTVPALVVRYVTISVKSNVAQGRLKAGQVSILRTPMRIKLRIDDKGAHLAS